MSRSQEPEVLSDENEGDFKNDFKDGRMQGRDDDFGDFDDEFTASTAHAPVSSGAPRPGHGSSELHDSQVVSNRPYDEAVELDDDEDSHPSPPMGARGGGGDVARRVAGGSAGEGQILNSREREEEGDEGVVKNQPFDEAMELSSEDSVADAPTPQAQHAGAMGMDAGAARSSVPGHGHGDEHGVYPEEEEPRMASGRGSGATAHAGMAAREEEEEEEEEDNVGPHREVTAGEEVATDKAAPPNMYNPADYEHLNVSSEIQELFQYIGRYKPHNIELETKMKPFIPDYVPAVGEIDPFVKVPRPDGKPDTLGLTVLDEPTSAQSDPVVMQLQLRAITKASHHQPVLVRSIEAADKDPKAIQNWIDSIKELHRNKPQPTVTYAKAMPEVEELMQIWPAEFEELLDTVKLPSADVDMSLADYAKLVCTVLDIPVHGSVMEPLHLLFTLFSDFKANVHFQQQFTNPNNASGSPQPSQAAPDQPNVHGQSESMSFE